MVAAQPPKKKPTNARTVVTADPSTTTTTRQTARGMPVAGATHAGPLALIQRKQTFEQLQDTAKLQAPSATALGDLASLLEIIKDLPAGTKSSRKLIEQVAQLTLPIQSIIDEVKHINFALQEKLLELGASNDTVQSFDDVFPFACIDSVENALIQNIGDSDDPTKVEAVVQDEGADDVASDEDAIAGGVESIILEDVGETPARPSFNSYRSVIPETPSVSDKRESAEDTTISLDWKRFSMGPDERILRKQFYPAVKRTWMGSWQAMKRIQGLYSVKLWPCFKLFSARTIAEFEDRRTIINGIVESYSRFEERVPGIGSYETLIETSSRVESYDQTTLRGKMAGMFSRVGDPPADRTQDIEDYLETFCLVNKRFVPELWKCDFMRKQLLNEDGTPVAGRILADTLLLGREDALGVVPEDAYFDKT